MTSKRSRGSRVVRILVALLALLCLAGLGGAGAFYLAFVRDLPDLQNVTDYRPPLASHVFDRNGRAIGVFHNERRQLTPFEEIPEHVILAFVAAEDDAFFEHTGIDYRSILRAAWVNLRAGGVEQGASTITQQMVKGLLLSPERKFRRKIREMILARRIEQRFTKEEILYLYLNQIYFGRGAYGIGEAARSYFGVGVADLSVAQAAQLAGLPKAPSRFSPFNDPDRAESRRRYVLGRMLEEGYIDPETHALAVAETPEFTESIGGEEFAAAAYFTEEVRRTLFDALGGDTVLEGGLRIETTLDVELQKTAVAAVRKGLEDLDHRQGYRGSVRKVATADIPAELETLAIENELVEKEPEALEAEEVAGQGETEDESGAAEPEATVEAMEEPPAAEPPVAEEAVASAEEEPDPLVLFRERLEDERPLLGVVTAVEAEAELARVGFSPEISAVVELEDVTWARKANPDVPGEPVTRIDRVFRVGDVAHFQLLPASQPGAPESQEEAAEAAEPVLRATLYPRPIVQGALLSLDVSSGDVLALVGGYDFSESEFDRVIQARRQPGSAFKPLTYGAALAYEDDQGFRRYTPASIIHDRPKVYEDRRTGFVWKPKNYGRKFYGPITLRKALAKSVNNAAVHLCDDVGVDQVMAYAKRLGIESPLERSLALALGTSGVSLLELTRAYAVFPAGGRRVVPRFIRRVIDRDGNVLFEDAALGVAMERLPDPDAEVEEMPEEEVAAVEIAAAEVPAEGEEASEDPPPDPNQLISPEDAYLLTDMLMAVVNEGTGWRLKELGRRLGGKTGTTNDQADAWFMGFSPDIVTGVWVGHDESRFLGFGETGSRAAAPIWVDYMRVALEGRPMRDFPVPESIVFTRIDRETGLLATRNSTDTIWQPFIAGSEPTETADTRRTTDEALRDLREDALTSDSAMRMMQMDSF
jgi:penicillin-binding protein 1A